jgi:hypothetical protein
MKAQALSEKVPLVGPQTTLPNDCLHALEPARHGGVVFKEVKHLGSPFGSVPLCMRGPLGLGVHPSFRPVIEVS